MGQGGGGGGANEGVRGSVKRKRASVANRD